MASSDLDRNFFCCDLMINGLKFVFRRHVSRHGKYLMLIACRKKRIFVFTYFGIHVHILDEILFMI